MNIYFLSQNLASFITILYPKLFNIFEDIQIKKSQRAKYKKTAMVWWVDSSWAKAAIKRPEKMEKHKEFLKQHFFILKEQEALQETKTNTWVLQKLWYQ